jgi:hypothetical protein
MPDINIGSKLDAKGFKQAETALGKLNSSAKKLAGSFGLAFGAAAVVQFGKNSVRAFIDAQREAAVLATTVRNLGLAFEQPTIDAYISKIGRLYGVTGEQAVPAFQALLSATGSASKSIDIFNTALDVSKTLGLDVTQVAESLSQAYLGNTKSLNNYNTGLTKAELSTLNFSQIQDKLNKTFAGGATTAAKTYSDQLLILTEAGSQAQEVLGKGIIDSLMILSGDTTVEELADTMLNAAENAAQLSINLSKVIKTLNTPLDVASRTLAYFIEKTDPFVDLIVEGDPSGFIKKRIPTLPTNGRTGALGVGTVLKTAEQKKQDEQRAKAEKDAIARAKALAKLVEDQAKSQAKILKDKRLSDLIDKANLKLNKNSEIFDLDKIQIQAALNNQAEQLGRTTSAAQQIQIANDTARLNVKKSINDLEDAIAAKDEKAIIAATKRLEADVKNLDALTGQNTQLATIKSILEGLEPKKLIDIDNLKQALDLLGQINGGKTGGVAASGIPVGDYISPVSRSLASEASASSIIEFAEAAAARANAFADLLDAQNKADAAAFNASSLGTSAGNTFIINTGVGDPNAIAEAIDDVLRQARSRGTLVALP